VVGISCRSGTMLVYASGQTLLLFLWFCDWKFWKKDSNGRVKAFGKDSYRMHWANLLWYFLFTTATLATVFTSIGGTSECSNLHLLPLLPLELISNYPVFAFMNLYVNCLCFIPVSHHPIAVRSYLFEPSVIINMLKPTYR
jgi:hypothetical protein